MMQTRLEMKIVTCSYRIYNVYHSYNLQQHNRIRSLAVIIEHVNDRLQRLARLVDVVPLRERHAAPVRGLGRVSVRACAMRKISSEKRARRRG